MCYVCMWGGVRDRETQNSHKFQNELNTDRIAHYNLEDISLSFDVTLSDK